MKVLIQESEEKTVIRLGDIFVDKDHNGLYLSAKVDGQIVLAGFDGNYWGVWQSIEEFKAEAARHIQDNRFVHYSQNEYVLELLKQVRE